MPCGCGSVKSVYFFIYYDMDYELADDFFDGLNLTASFEEFMKKDFKFPHLTTPSRSQSVMKVVVPLMILLGGVLLIGIYCHCYRTTKRREQSTTVTMPKQDSQEIMEHDPQKENQQVVLELDTLSDEQGREDPERIPDEENDNNLNEITVVVNETDQASPEGNKANRNEEEVRPNRQDSPTANEPLLDSELLAALGENTIDDSKYGENIHANLTKLWLPLLKKGMSKKGKEDMINEYLIPDNCRLLQAPILNEEISAVLTDVIRNRDEKLLEHQQQLGSGITAINRGIDMLLKSDNKAQAIKHLGNGCRLLCDLHYLTTQERKSLINTELDTTLLQVVKENERDETLFGSSISEKITATKTSDSQKHELKKPVIAQKPKTPDSEHQTSSS